MQGRIELDELKTLDELKEIKDPFERINIKVRTIITVFGDIINGKKNLNLTITYNEIVNEDGISYSIIIKHLDEIVYDRANGIYKANGWEVLLDTMYNFSYTALKLGEEIKQKRLRKGN